MIDHVTSGPVRALVLGWMAVAAQESAAEGAGSGRLKIQLESDGIFDEWFRREVDFVDYVDEPRDADVCVRVTALPTRGAVRRYDVSFAGAGAFACIESGARLCLRKEQSVQAA